LRRLIELAAVGVLIVGCGGAAATPNPTPAPTAAPPAPATTGGGGGTQVAVDEHEWQIGLAQSSLPAGEVTFNINNTGEKDHEFVIVKTDLAQDQLPVADDEVNEDDPALTHIDELEDIAAGTSGNTLTVDLDPGTYVVFCNLTAHYGKGMHSTFTVQ
jgi:uncharacterized cupredoxin-like copper-binding protein